LADNAGANSLADDTGGDSLDDDAGADSLDDDSETELTSTIDIDEPVLLKSEFVEQIDVQPMPVPSARPANLTVSVKVQNGICLLVLLCKVLLGQSVQP
jgi:hypothetical protein